MEAQGYDGDEFVTAASIRMGSMRNDLTGNNDMPGRIDFHTTSDNTNSNQLRMRIDDNGNVGIGTTTIDAKLVVNGRIKASELLFTGLPVRTDEADASSGATPLTQGEIYQTPTGEIRIKL